MVRTSVLKALICAGLVSMMPTLAHSAGLGKLTVSSALGQPLKAEIELVAVEKDELSAITARVASPQAYKEANLDRPGTLANIRFDVAQKANGEPVLRIVSTRTFNEPFVNLLIELSYPSGRLLREYTVLLDPQGAAQAQTFDPIGPPVVKSRTTNGSQSAAPSENAGTTERAGAPATSESATAGGDAGSYTVKKGDSLARIAANVKPQEVSLEQAMIGIYANNKSAFVGGNMNRLRRGQILNVPPATELAQVKPATAAREIKAHAADWNAYRQRLAANVESKAVTQIATQQSASGKITTGMPDASGPATAPKDVLRLSKGETGSAGTGGGGKETAQLRDKVATLQEEAIARERAVKEANERVAALEKNLQEMRKLLELRNQNLADLQKQAARANAAPVPTPTPVPAPVVTAPTPTPVPTPAPVVQAPQPAPAPATPEPLVKALPDSTAPSAPIEPKAAEPAKTVEPATPPATAESGSSLMGHIRDNALMLAAMAVGGLILLLALLKVLNNRHRRSLATFEDSIMTGGDLKANTVFGNTHGGSIDTGDTSFLTDFSQAGMGTIDTNDVDPIAEAEVYMAYGRDAQAEEILKEAMSKDPNRHEIKVKLLEIYAARKNLIAFETLASELYAATGGKSTPAWLKAAEMGRALDPDNPLYGSTQGLPVDEPDTVGSFISSDAPADVDADVDRQIAGMGPSGEDDAVWDLQSDQTEESNIVNFGEKRADAALGDDMDFDLNQSDAAQDVRGAHAKNDVAALSALDADSIISQAYGRADNPADTFTDLDEVSLDQQTISPGDGADDLSLDFSLSDDDAIPAVEAAQDNTSETLGEGLDFDFNLDDEANRATDNAASPSQVDLSGIDLDLDNNQLQPAAIDDLVFDGDLPAGEEVATKLDLAKAYMEMGDKEGAREILEEVMQEGDSQQKDDAKKLLAAVS